jgi:hypothetical protein
MDRDLHIDKYQVFARFRDGVIEWSLALQTENGEHYTLQVRDGEEIPILLDICRRDRQAYFDPATRTLRTGWNPLGSDTEH